MMRCQDLRKRIEELCDVLMPFAGPTPKRGRRAGALYVGLIPVAIFNQYTFDEALEALKKTSADELEKIDLLTRLGKNLAGTNIYLDFDGTWHSTRANEDGSKVHEQVYSRAPFELRINKDGWAYSAPVNKRTGRAIKVKF